MKNIPEIVKKEAKELIGTYDNRLKHIGKYNDYDVYYFIMPKDVDNGFPFLYLHNGDNIREVTGFDALDIIKLLIKD